MLRFGGLCSTILQRYRICDIDSHDVLTFTCVMVRWRTAWWSVMYKPMTCPCQFIYQPRIEQPTLSRFDGNIRQKRNWPDKGYLGPVSLRLMASQFKDIVTHTPRYKTVKCTFFSAWVQHFVWNFNFTWKNLNTYTVKYAFYEVLCIWRLMVS